MYQYAAVVTAQHDGDTCHLDLDLGLRIHRVGERYRLARINAPELSTPEGVAAAAAFAAKVPVGTQVTVTTSKPDNYGRWLVEIVLADGTNINDWMVANGYAVPYPPAPPSP